MTCSNRRKIIGRRKRGRGRVRSGRGREEEEVEEKKSGGRWEEI